MRFTRIVAAAALVLAPSVTFAQSFTGTIVGTIKDSSGAAIPHATVSITSQQTGRQDSVTADIEGRYTSLPLPPGEYRVEATLQGFKSAVRSNVVVTIASTVVIDFALEVGELTEAVEVSASALSLETTSSTVGKLVDNRRIQELPLNTRNVYSLIFLTPGVAGTIGNNYNSMSYSVNGARPTMMDTVIDGVTASFPTVNGFTGISVFPSVDAIQEFKVMGANYPAEYGRSLGSVLNVVYKSGSNDFHGSAYEFFRDSAFDENNYFSEKAGTPLGDFQRSQFGGVAGGPIRRGKTFFMTSYEGLREDSASETTTTVPTLAQRNGDFSQTFAQNGQLIRIFDPFTTRPNPSGSGFIRDPVPEQRDSGRSHGSGGATGAELLSAAQSTREFRDRGAELFRDRHRQTERRQHRRARRPQLLREGAVVRPLLVPQDLQLAGGVLPRRPHHRRRPRHRGEPRAQRRHRLQPDNLEHDADDRAPRLRAHAVRLRQPGARLQAVEPRAAGVDRSERRSRDVPALRRQRHGVARRQRPSLQRVHELHRGGEPHESRAARTR